ncbi:MAG: BACON domain-containing carbohydrate-binding protein, partial [Bacteroidota bacterium]
FTIHIPDDYLGVLNLDAFGFTPDNNPDSDAPGSGGEYVGMDSIHLIVLPDASLDSLSMQPDTVFVPMGGTASVAVSAHFSNGMSGLATLVPGLVFEVSDSSLLQFTAPGILKGLSAGTAQATAAWQGQTASTTVVVLPPPADAYLEIAPPTLAAPPGGGNLAFGVSTNQPWEVNVEPGGEWVSVATQAGIGNDTVVLSCLPNPASLPRQATLLVEASGLSKTLLVTQAAQPLFLAAEPDTFICSAAANIRKIAVASNSAWSMTQKPIWISINPVNSVGSDTLTLTIEANPLFNFRFGVIELSAAGGLTKKLLVMQKPKPVFPPVPPTVPVDMLTVLSGNGVSLQENASHERLTPEPAANEPSACSLQVFPNPSHGSFRIVFSLPENQTVRLELRSTSGQVAATLANGNFEAGEHEISFDASGLPPGTYWCQLAAGEESQVVKIILL